MGNVARAAAITLDDWTDTVTTGQYRFELQDVAAKYIKSMSGDHRMPQMLKMVDRLSRSGK